MNPSGLLYGEIIIDFISGRSIIMVTLVLNWRSYAERRFKCCKTFEHHSSSTQLGPDLGAGEITAGYLFRASRLNFY